MTEIWKELYGIDSFYRVSNMGRVKSIDRSVNHSRRGIKLVKELILKPAVRNKRYNTVTLHIEGKMKSFYLHRLVAMAFIPNPLNKKEVNHKNGIKTDNRIENLEWTTRHENISHAEKNGLLPQGEQKANAILTNVDVIKIKSLLSERKLKQTEIAKLFGVKPYVINFINTGRSWVKVV